MSKFNQIKNVFEKEKEKKKTSSTKLKSITSSRIKTSTKLKTNPKGNHHNNSNNGDPIRLEGKVVPPNTTTSRFSFRNKQEVEKILLRKVVPQTTQPDMTTTAPPLQPAAAAAAGAAAAVAHEPQDQDQQPHLQQQQPATTTTSTINHHTLAAPTPHPATTKGDDIKRFPSNLCKPQGWHRVKIRYGGTNIVPPGTTLRNVAHCAGLKIPNNVITAAPTPPLPQPQVPQIATIQSKQPPPNHNQHQPPDPIVPPRELGKPRIVTPKKVSKLSELRKLFESKIEEDNPLSKKTALYTRKEDTVRKTTLQEDTQPHLQYDQEVLTNSIFVSTYEVKFGMTDDPTRRRPDIFVTPCLDVPPGLPDSTTAVQETCTTPSNLTTSNFPRRH